jgi:hypothetical protein
MGDSCGKRCLQLACGTAAYAYASAANSNTTAIPTAAPATNYYSAAANINHNTDITATNTSSYTDTANTNQHADTTGANTNAHANVTAAE